jgi:hypothetical protein
MNHIGHTHMHAHTYHHIGPNPQISCQSTFAHKEPQKKMQYSGRHRLNKKKACSHLIAVPAMQAGAAN